MSLLRRLLKSVGKVLFTDVTRRLGPLLEGTELRITHREPAFLGRTIEIVMLRKEAEVKGEGPGG